MEEENIKRGRGRPRTKPKSDKPVGRPRKYEKGYVAHRSSKMLVDRNRYDELLEIEKKYLEIKDI